jgi:hypothetical protein
MKKPFNLRLQCSRCLHILQFEALLQDLHFEKAELRDLESHSISLSLAYKRAVADSHPHQEHINDISSLPEPNYERHG